METLPQVDSGDVTPFVARGNTDHVVVRQVPHGPILLFLSQLSSDGGWFFVTPLCYSLAIAIT